MSLTDLLTHRHDDPLPADHRAEAERDGDRDLHPGRNELGGGIQRALVAIERRNTGIGQPAVAALHEQAKRLRHQVHVVTRVADGLRREFGQRTVLNDLVADLADENGE